MFKGSIVALVTPMHVTGEIDYVEFERLLDWHIENQTDGVVILGTTGEAATITADEKKRLIQRAIGFVKGRIPVIIGTGTNSTSSTIEQTQLAMKLGADAALVVTPYYNKPTQEGLYQHFTAVATAVPLPLILYNVPSRTGCDLLPETILRLASQSNVVGVKEATGQVDRVAKLIEMGCQLDLLSGDDGTALSFMQAGGRGVISVVANVAPLEVHRLCEFALSGALEQANLLDEQLKPLYKALFIESNPIPTKWALAEMGLISPGIRLPLTWLSLSCQSEVRGALDRAAIRYKQPVAE